MKLNIRFKDGVSSGLCGGCEHALIRFDFNDRESVECSWSHPALRITRPIKHCSEYQAKGSQDKYEMEKVAWILEVKKGRVIGFRPPKAKSDD